MTRSYVRVFHGDATGVQAEVNAWLGRVADEWGDAITDVCLAVDPAGGGNVFVLVRYFADKEAA